MSSVEALLKPMRTGTIKPSRTFRRDRQMFRLYRSGTTQGQLAVKFGLSLGEVGHVLAHEMAIERRREVGVDRDHAIRRAQRRAKNMAYWAEHHKKTTRNDAVPQREAANAAKRAWADQLVRAAIAREADEAMTAVWERHYG